MNAEIVADAFPSGIFASISGAWHGAALFPDESCAQFPVAELFERLTIDPEACSE